MLSGGNGSVIQESALAKMSMHVRMRSMIAWMFVGSLVELRVHRVTIYVEIYVPLLQFLPMFFDLMDF